jgi:transposase InsO family protein
MNDITYNAILKFHETGDCPQGLSFHALYNFKRKARLFTVNKRTKKLYLDVPEKRIRVVKLNELNKVISSFYYDTTTGFIGRDKLYPKLKEQYYGITKVHVTNFLNSQKLHQMLQPQRKYRVTQPILAYKSDERWVIDLINAPNPYFNSNIHFILNIVDHHSKYLYSFPIKNKEAATIAECLETIFQSERVPDIIQSDNGKEFLGETIDLCDRYGVKQVHSLPYKPMTNGAIERLNKTMKEKMKAYMTNNNTKVYINIYKDLVYNYNHTIHSTTGKTPHSVYIDKEKVNMKRVEKKADDMTKKDHINVFRKGEKVRISLYDAKTKLRKAGAKWSNEIYTVYAVSKDKVPKIYLEKTNNIYYGYQLLRVNKDVSKIEPFKKIVGKDDVNNKKENRLRKILQ